MNIKPGVNVTGIKPEIILALMAAQAAFFEHGHRLVLTSALDGKHSSGSLHYSGNAVDLRTRDLEGGLPARVVAALKESLGTQYDVVLERDHIHIEFQPKA